jgi:predicted nucleic-acid-binding Zn-ribbon protein
MLEGKCPKCGTHRIGWALRYPRYQTCPKCGTGLEITEDGKLITEGYSPFTAEEYTIDMPTNIPHSQDEEDIRRQDKR